jgi:hypothetical protein
MITMPRISAIVSPVPKAPAALATGRKLHAMITPTRNKNVKKSMVVIYQLSHVNSTQKSKKSSKKRNRYTSPSPQNTKKRESNNAREVSVTACELSGGCRTIAFLGSTLAFLVALPI